MKIVDARELACPQPLIETKKVIDSITEPTVIEVLVGDDIAANNVLEYIKALGLKGSRDGLKITFEAKEGVSTATPSALSCPTSTPSDNWGLVISSQIMGKGSEELGAILLKAFINTLPQTSSMPSHIIMYNEGVKCATSQLGVLESLQTLEDMGVSIIVCGTCVEYFDIRNSIEVGVISNMLKIIETKQALSKIVYL